ncbi:hypothetical protein [Actinocorallia sp. A-T 12471]|uniref:hypothetical protein n=1 Tax=Actinocorallia sp. A-T 12471 TaxID=3089813 RepID=UPI0029D18793|nr:hypothetical protein [Actinocorallia sp. A-T 12471]MDX6744097.1 hypothetical protein [Actinocorallia sp. A-T 12471]
MKRPLALAMCGAVAAGVAAVGATAAPASAAESGWVYSDKWGVIGRNTLGSPVADLRFGPWGRTSATSAATQAPPYGRGSLGLEVAAGPDPTVVTNAEKVAYGNETDFAGLRLRDIRTVRYSIFAGMDSIDGVALPGIAFEVDPNLNDTVNYSTLGYLPHLSTAPSSPSPRLPNRWQEYDAAADGSQWFATGQTGADSGCILADPCTFAELKLALPNAVVTYSVQFQKGRDNAFVGAVDGLRLNNTVYDFEYNGVRKRKT